MKNKTFIPTLIIAILSSSSAYGRTRSHYNKLGGYYYKTQGSYVGLNLVGTKLSVKTQLLYKGSSSIHNIGLGLDYKYAFNYRNFFIAPGIFADYDHSVAKMYQVDVNGNITKNYKGSERVNYRYGVRADMGYDIANRFSPYFIAGFGIVNISSTLSAANGAQNIAVNKSSLLFGGGIKVRVVDNVIFNLEYNVQNLNLRNKTYDAKIQDKIEVVKFGVSYKF